MAHSNTTTSQIRIITSTEPSQTDTLPPSDRNEWYQTDQEIVLSVFIRNTRPEDLVIITNQQSVSITHKPSSSSSDHPHPSPQLLIDPLSHDIDPTRSTWKCFPSKIELKLFKKVQGINWKSLQRPKPLDGSNPGCIDLTLCGQSSDLTPQLVIAAPTTDSSQKAPIYPSSSKKKTDWDRLANSLEKEDQQEIQNSGLDPNSGGDRALNELFQKLYADATDDQRRAMMKSYTESNGTALSTDWEDVKKKKVETKPPQSVGCCVSLLHCVKRLTDFFLGLARVSASDGG
ncbi:SGS domain-domain-containing protein [Phakopsora pachyrhizi]|uniref:SGS domain-domain-containing protein n=1 Tax=Phakopsora pachyrhizi TaxID=170000 RepID=A0AAV0B7V8_PHAPC|nr:SGS domain-domain-containing protein [Phakopsora pachyrhizi]